MQIFKRKKNIISPLKFTPQQKGKNIKCPQCTKIFFLSEYELEREYPDEYRVTCGCCGKVEIFTGDGSFVIPWRRYYRIVSDEWLFVCPTCVRDDKLLPL